MAIAAAAAAEMEIDNPQMAGSATASATASAAAGGNKPNPFADEVERIVQSAEGRELSSAAIGGSSNSINSNNSPMGSPRPASPEPAPRADH